MEITFVSKYNLSIFTFVCKYLVNILFGMWISYLCDFYMLECLDAAVYFFCSVVKYEIKQKGHKRNVFICWEDKNNNWELLKRMRDIFWGIVMPQRFKNAEWTATQTIRQFEQRNAAGIGLYVIRTRIIIIWYCTSESAAFS